MGTKPIRADASYTLLNAGNLIYREMVGIVKPLRGFSFQLFKNGVGSVHVGIRR